MNSGLDQRKMERGRAEVVLRSSTQQSSEGRFYQHQERYLVWQRKRWSTCVSSCCTGVALDPISFQSQVPPRGMTLQLETKVYCYELAQYLFLHLSRSHSASSITLQISTLNSAPSPDESFTVFYITGHEENILSDDAIAERQITYNLSN